MTIYLDDQFFNEFSVTQLCLLRDPSLLNVVLSLPKQNCLHKVPAVNN